LLPPAAVDPDTGYRFYAAEQLEDAELIETLRRADVPLSQIRVILRDRCPGRLDEWASRLRSDNQRRQGALERARELLRAAQSQTPRTEGGDTVRIDTASRTEKGSVRENNEDAALARDRLIAVADGMGGHAAGETAAALAMEVVSAVVTEKSVDELEAAVRAANWAVWQRATDDAELQGMGTTLCAVAAVNGELAVANVGDSRAYLRRGEALKVLSHDHTVAAEMVRSGQLAADAAAQHPHRRLLTRAASGRRRWRIAARRL
jgi:DNA-binding transcriptional MerR regulator